AAPDLGTELSLSSPLTPLAPLLSKCAPTAIVLPSLLSATELPNSSNFSLCEPLTYACWAQVVPVRVKKYTAPASSAESSSCFPLMPLAALSSLGAPTASVLPSPLHARATPNQSSLPVFDALINACCDHFPPVRVNTYAAPDDISVVSSSAGASGGWMPVSMLSSSSAPAAAVLPSSLMTTQHPIESCASAFDAWRRAWCDHVEPLRVRM